MAAEDAQAASQSKVAVLLRAKKGLEDPYYKVSQKNLTKL